MRTKLQIVSVLAASLFSLGMQAQPASTLDEFGGTNVDATIIKPVAGDYTLEVDGTAGTPIVVNSVKFTYTPTTTCKVRFVRSSGTVYVYEGHKYMGTVTTETPDATIFPSTNISDNNATNKTGIYEATNLIKNPGFESVGSDIYGSWTTSPVGKQPDNWTCNGFTTTSTPSRAVAYPAKDPKSGSTKTITGENNYYFLLHYQAGTDHSVLSQDVGPLNSFTTYKLQFDTWPGSYSSSYSNANIKVTLGKTVGTGALFSATTSLNGSFAIWTHSYTIKTDEMTTDDIYFAIEHTLNIKGVAGLDRIVLIPATSEPRGITGVTTVSYLAGTAYAPTSSTTLDESTTYTPVAASRINVSLARTLKTGKWNTMCLPFAMNGTQLKAAFGDNVRVSKFSGVSGSTLSFTDLDLTSESSVANTPYLIMPTSATSPFSIEDVNIEVPTNSLTVTDATYNFIGTYTAGGNVPDGAYYIYENKFYQAATPSASPISGFRAYFTTTGVGAKEMSINVDGTPTSISEINGAEANAPANIYNLNGQLIRRNATSTNSLAKGIYIVNGKKVTVK